MKRAFQIVLAGHSLRDIDFQDRVLDEILSLTGGWKVGRMNEQDLSEFTYLYLTRLGHKHLNMVYAGGYSGMWNQPGPPDYIIKYRELAMEQVAKEQASGLLVQSGGDSMMGTGSSIGGGGNASFEQFVSYDPADKESIKAVIQCMKNAVKDAIDHGFPGGHPIPYLQMAMTDEQLYEQLKQSPQPTIFHFQRKIKKLLDPNDTGDRLYQILPESKNI